MIRENGEKGMRWRVMETKRADKKYVNPKEAHKTKLIILDQDSSDDQMMMN